MENRGNVLERTSRGDSLGSGKILLHKLGGVFIIFYNLHVLLQLSNITF